MGGDIRKQSDRRNVGKLLFHLPSAEHEGMSQPVGQTSETPTPTRASLRRLKGGSAET